MYGFSYSGALDCLIVRPPRLVSDYSMYVAGILHRKRYGTMRRKRG